MKAPDKIYLLRNKISVILSSWFSDSDNLLENIEYIRKDALLEWAKEKAMDYKQTANIRRSFEMMIRKIESL